MAARNKVDAKSAQSRSKALRQITRFEYGNTRGWWVRFSRQGTETNRFFSDGRHGGKLAALRAAKLYRDATEKILPERSLRVQERGKGRIFREQRSYRNARGEVIRYEAWSIWVRLEDGRPSHTSFSIAKNGEKKAKAMARAALRARL